MKLWRLLLQSVMHAPLPRPATHARAMGASFLLFARSSRYRFAGTAERGAYTTLMRYLRYFSSLRRVRVGAVGTAGAKESQQRPDPATLEMCIGAVAVALGMVMAGRGDLSALRLLRELRGKAS